MSKVDVLDKGYVRLRDHMGDDLTVVNAARVSFDKRSGWRPIRERDPKGHWEPEGRWSSYITVGKEMKERDKKLLRFLAREGHWSPFSHPHVMLEIKAPIMVLRQWEKHKVGSRFTEIDDTPWNEMSGRYVSEELEFYIPQEWRSAPDNRKQGSGGALDQEDTESLHYLLNENRWQTLRDYEAAVDVYGVAPEQARLFLPYAAMYTKLMWTPSLYTVLRFLELREDEHAQWEIRQYAQAVRDLVQPLFPESFAAFEEVT